MHYRKISPKVSVSIVFIAAMFISIMDVTIVNVALPALSRQFHVPGSSIDAVVVGYLISLTVIIPVSGWIGDHWGTKRVFLLALVLFSLTSALCGLAQNFLLLVCFRVLQGIAGGALVPVGTTLLYRTFPHEERVSLSRVLSIPVVVAPASGPVIGGFLVEHVSWRWVFYVNVPIGIIASLFGLFFLYDEGRELHSKPFDLTGFLLAGSGLALVMYALTEGPTAGWISPGIFTCMIMGLLALSMFVIVELRIREPMLDLRLLGNRLFCTSNLVSLFSNAGFFGLLFLTPIFLQEARGVSPLISGLTTFPEAIGVIVSTQIVTLLYPKVGPRRLVTVGLIDMVGAISLLGLIGLETNLWLVRVLMFLTGAGMASVFAVVQAIAFAGIVPAATSRATAFYSAQRQIGSALGVAVLSTVLGILRPVSSGTQRVAQMNLIAYHVAFLASAMLVLIAVCFALAIHDRDVEVMHGQTDSEEALELWLEPTQKLLPLVYSVCNIPTQTLIAPSDSSSLTSTLPCGHPWRPSLRFCPICGQPYARTLRQESTQSL